MADMADTTGDYFQFLLSLANNTLANAQSADTTLDKGADYVLGIFGDNKWTVYTNQINQAVKQHNDGNEDAAETTLKAVIASLGGPADATGTSNDLTYVGTLDDALKQQAKNLLNQSESAFSTGVKTIAIVLGIVVGGYVLIKVLK